MELELTLSKENLALSKAEATHVLKSKDVKAEGNLLTIKTKRPSNVKKLAYTKEAYEVLSEKDFLNIARSKETFKATKITEEAKELIKKMEELGLKANLENPDFEFKANPKSKILYWRNNEKYEDRLAHKLPSHKPVALHPKLARAMVNLADSDEVLDPFCGAGGILIEAGLIGNKVTGIDIEEEMIEASKKNLDYFNIESKLERGDALTKKIESKAIVSDLPYGRSSKMSKNTQELLTKLIEKHPDSKKVLCIPSEVKTPPVKQEFKIYIHRSLTRKIIVL